MKRQMFFATVFSAALAVGAAAQTGTGTGTAQTGSQQDKQVTMTGCLQKATSGTAGTSGTATGTASSSDEFILANATSGSASSSPAGTSGTASGTAASSAMGSKYKLSGGDREDLTKYLNSKVEVRGTIDRSSAGSMAGSGTGTGATGTRAGQSDDKNLPTLRVTSVRQVAETCTGGN